LAVKDKKRRLFFALWPSAKVRQSIVEAADPLLREVDARIIAPQNFHITLHFIGSATDHEKACLHQAAQSVTFQSFDLSLDSLVFRQGKNFLDGDADGACRIKPSARNAWGSIVDLRFSA